MKAAAAEHLADRGYASRPTHQAQAWRLTRTVRWALLLAACALVTAQTPAATNIVLATDNLQQKINEAAPGDILVLQDSVLNSTLSANAGKLTAKRCHVSGRIALANLDFTGMRLTNTGALQAVASIGTGR